jgi:outer membrane protein insertion porin family
VIARVLPVLLVAGPLASGEPAAIEETAVYGVDVEFAGNRAVPDRRLKDSLAGILVDMRRNGVSAGIVDDAVYELERRYASLGFRRASVVPAWKNEKGAFKVRFRIEEGPRSFLKDVVIEGNRAIGAAELKACFPWLRVGWVPGFRRAVFTENALSDGESAMTTLYQLDGYYQVRAFHEVIEDGPEAVRVFIGVIEGPKIVMDVPPLFLGSLSFPEEELLAALDLHLPTPFVPRLPLVLKGKLIDFYRNRGHRFVDIDVERRIEPDVGEAFLTFRIREGPLTTIGGVVLRGNEHTEDWVIRQRVHLRPGDLYKEEKVRRSAGSLIAAGLFSSVHMETVPLEGREDKVDLVVTVNESPRFRFTLLGGYGSYEMLRGSLVFEDTNLFGIGHKVRLEGKGSFRGEGASGEYTNPFFFHENLAQTIRGSYDRRQHPSFTERSYGGDTGLTYRPARSLTTRLFYRLKESQARDVSASIPENLRENVFISSVLGSILLDRRNNFVDPDRGMTGRVTMEYAGGPLGSELEFVRPTGLASWVLSLTKGVRLVTAARAGSIVRLESTRTIPIQERFFNGGEDTIRSFLEDKAGPSIDGEPIGGEAFTVYNAEVRFPLFLLENLQGAAFFDAGTLNERVQDIGRGRYFLGVGGGARYVTPVGPFRLDLAVNPDRQDGEDLLTLHFALGYPF